MLLIGHGWSTMELEDNIHNKNGKDVNHNDENSNVMNVDQDGS